MKNKMLNILNSFGKEDIHILGDIPPNKLQTAVKNYPIDADDTILSLIDGTVLGSAKVGMAIGLKGIYFRNDWTTDTRKNFFSWQELKGTRVEKGAWFCISIAPGSEFNVSGAGISRNTLINLLNELIENYSEKYVSTMSIVLKSTYEKMIPRLIALSIVADGIVDDSEIDTAFSIIENDEIVKNKAEAFKLLNFEVNDLLSKREKSEVLFKLKMAEIVTSASEILGENEKEKVLIILDGMYESASREGKKATGLIRNKIQEKFLMSA